MVFVLTEEQKQQLESRGISVIQFKKMCYWFKGVVSQLFDAIKSNPQLMDELKRINDADT